MKPSVQHALEAARRALDDLYGDRLAKVILYGSQARGEAHPDSDIDVLVVLRGPFDVYAELKRLAGLQARLLSDYQELVVFQPFEEASYEDGAHPLMMNVHAEGIAL